MEEEVGQLESISPNDGSLLAKVNLTGSKSYEQIMEASTEAYKTWQMVPAPRRGLLVKAMADALRINKDALGSLVSLEMGKIKAEGDGEVQEMIDIADFAVGLSRQLYGLTMHSERPLHRCTNNGITWSRWDLVHLIFRCGLELERFFSCYLW